MDRWGEPNKEDITNSPRSCSEGMRKFKLKVSGSTQTMEDRQGTSSPMATPTASRKSLGTPSSSRKNLATPTSSRKAAPTNSDSGTVHGHNLSSSADYYQSSPQRGMAPGMMLSDTTRERLLASQQRQRGQTSAGGQTYSTKSRNRLSSRDRQTPQNSTSNIKHFSNGYYSDSGDSVYGENFVMAVQTEGQTGQLARSGQPVGQPSRSGQPSAQMSRSGQQSQMGVPRATHLRVGDQMMVAVTGDWQAGSSAGGDWQSHPIWYHQTNYKQQQHNHPSSPMRAANSLESLDSTSGSVGQNRGTSYAQVSSQDPISFCSPQLMRINRSTSLSNRITTEEPKKVKQTFSLRKPSGTDDSEYYGVPIQSPRVGESGKTGQQRHHQYPDSNSSSMPRPRHGDTSGGVNRNYRTSGSAGNTLSFPSKHNAASEDGAHMSALHFSSFGLLSGDDRLDQEMQRLRKELKEEQEKVARLSSQLSTNAHVVSAFEQSLSNMTSRLQHLTRSADEKDKELHELHKTIENLGKQGALLTLGKYRVSSSESLCSKNGLTSDSDNDDLSRHGGGGKRVLNFKQRKSRWFQQSLSKAFSRTRKNSGSVSEAEHSIGQRRINVTMVDSATSCPGSPIPRGHHRSKSAPILDDVESHDSMDELRQQLRLKENLLTETRLDALSSAHQLQSLRETVAKLRGELNLLRRENERLQQDKAPSLPNTINRTLLEPNCAFLDSYPRAGNMKHTSSHQGHLSLERDNLSPSYMSTEADSGRSFSYLSAEGQPGTGSMSYLSADGQHEQSSSSSSSLCERLEMGRGESGLQVLTAPGSLDRNLMAEEKNGHHKSYTSSPSPTLLRHKLHQNNSKDSPRRGEVASSSSQEINPAEDRRGRSLLHAVCSVETDKDEACVPVSVISSGLSRRAEVKIGYVTLSRNSSWVHLDDCLRGLVKTYLLKLDPENCLELSNQSMVCYQCGNIRRVFKNPEPERGPNLLPDTRIWVSFRGGTDRGSLEDLAFTTLIPKTAIKRYVATLSKYQRGVIVGPPGSGKTFLAKRLAEFLVLKSGEELHPNSIAVFMANKASLHDCRDFVSKIRKTSSDRFMAPSVVIIENIQHHGVGVPHIFSGLEGSGGSGEDTPFIICTSTPTESIQEMQSRFNFAELSLGDDVELVQGFLGRYLRRKMLNIEVAARMANLDMPEAIQWILRIYCNLYIFVRTTSRARTVLSPQQFLPCPVESTQSLRSWFVDLWNSSLVFQLRQVAEDRSADEEAKDHFGGQDFEDPVRFVIRTWPWLDMKEGLPQALLKVKKDNRHQAPLANSANGAAVPDGQLVSAQIESKAGHDAAKDDPLLSMLLCLQEAAGYSGLDQNSTDCVGTDSENPSSDMSKYKTSSSEPDPTEDL